MTTKFKYLIFLSCIYACDQRALEESNPPQLFQEPEVVALDTINGYCINQFNGDSIRPIVLENGDTGLTGKAISVSGRDINSNSYSPPKRKVFDRSVIKVLESRKEKKIAKPEVVLVDKDSVDFIPFEVLKAPTEGHYIVNNIGDTIPTGVPIPISGKVSKAIQTIPIPAYPPQFKDLAVNNIQYLDVDQGLLTSYVFAIIEDKRGSFWFGYDMGGISKYDGSSFTHYTRLQGLNDDHLNTIFEDSKGNIWLGSFYGGIMRYNGKEFIHYSLEEGLLSPHVIVIKEDSYGNIWFAGNEGGVSRFDGEFITHFTTNEGLINNTVSDLIFDKKGNLWTAGIGGVSVYDGHGFRQYTQENGLSGDGAFSLLEDDKGHIWIVTNNGGLTKFDGNAFIQYKRENAFESEDVIPIFQDSKGFIWYGSTGGGLCRFDGKESLIFSTEEGLSNDYVKCIVEDSDGNIWVTTDGGGVNRIDPKSFSLSTKAKELGNNYTTTVLEDKKGRFWIGSFNNGVTVYDREKTYQISDKEGFVHNRIWDAIETKNGDLWFATHGDGVIRFDGNTFYQYKEEQGLSRDYVLSLLEDSKGNLWFGTSGRGVVIFDGQNFTYFDKSNGLINDDILTMIEDHKGNIWLGTYGGGVCKYDGKNFTHYTEKEGLSNNIVWSMIEDDDGMLWFGTNGGGLNRFDGKQFTYFSEKQGLSNNSIWSLIEDNNNSIWVGTEKGLSELRRNNQKDSINDISNESFIINRFSKNDGLKGLDFINNSVFLDKKGVMWWGTGKGLTSLDLVNRKQNRKKPRISLKSIEINEEFIDYVNASDTIRNNIAYDSVMPFHNYPLGLELPFDKNHLTFHFSAIDWASPHKLQYSYQIDNGHGSWSKLSSEGKADYRNLSYGKHTFKVRAIGASQEWSETFEYTFTILPPWYHTWWARVLYLIAGLLFIWGYARWRTASLKERQLQLEFQVKEATKEISAQKVEAEKQRDLIEEAHNEIKDSIQYAKRIQSAILPPFALINEYLPKSFVIYKPKDVVAGDFYWLEKKGKKVLFAAADCTGHGVPGAMVSVICNNGLNRSVREHGITEPAKILDKTREIVLEEFEKSDQDVKDGMDIALCALQGSELEYAGAHNPLWIVRKGKITESELSGSEKLNIQEFGAYTLAEIKADKQPIGKYDQPLPYTNHNITTKAGDRIYIFSDGLADQFGGKLGKKLKSLNVKRFLISIQNYDMKSQGDSLSQHFEEWKGELQQVDDVCFIGVEV